MWHKTARYLGSKCQGNWPCLLQTQSSRYVKKQTTTITLFPVSVTTVLNPGPNVFVISTNAKINGALSTCAFLTVLDLMTTSSCRLHLTTINGQLYKARSALCLLTFGSQSALRLVYKDVNTKIFTTTILPVVCRDVNLGLSWWRLRVFENRTLRKTFGPKRGEVTREWRRLHNEER
jgi:hypothetical protein